MEVSNATNLKVGFVTGRLPFPRHSLSLIVKGTFDLSPGAAAELAEEQLLPVGDEFYPDDDAMRGAPRYESDFAYFKPRADLLLAGRCHVPNGYPTRECQVTFRVGDRAATLVVSGDRGWERSGLGWRATEAEPFTEMELRYERSFGGRKFPTNPVGRGAQDLKDEQGNTYRPLPNIENPVDRVISPKSRPDPAGFGPLKRAWRTRHEKIGTYKGKYLKSRWPWLPEDFDWTHFNAAPEAGQLDGFLRGDEALYFEHLHPVHARYHSRLPGLRVRCFLNKWRSAGADETDFVETSMALDTLWVDMEAEKLVLVWRGWAEVQSEDYEEVRDLFIMSEPLETAPASLDECHRRFLDHRAEEEKEEVAADQVEAGPPDDVSTPAAAAARTPGVDRAHLEGQVNALLAQMGVDPESLPPEVREKQSRLLERVSETDADKVAELRRQELDVELRGALGKLDLDADHLPPVSAKAKAEQLRFMKELGLDPADVSADPEVAGVWAMMSAILPKMGLDPENLDPVIEQAKKQQGMLTKRLGEGGEHDTENEQPPLTREVVESRAAQGESFAGEEMSGLDLSGLQLAGLDFSRAKLAGTVLTDANLQGAILAGADLTGANLSGADLSAANLAGADLSEAKIERAVLNDADFTAATLSGATLNGAVLTDAVLEAAMMPGALLDGVEARDVNFSGADLTGSSFVESVCSGADFSKATLDQAAFNRAQLAEASMQNAVARQINLEGADLTALRASGTSDFTGSIFWRATGAESIWEGANLTGCDFRGCKMPNAMFTSACLKKANLSATDMKFSRFNKADLTEAQLIYMNLFQGNLERADLTDANLSRSNMYGVEFLNATVERTQLIGANLKMTKLHKR